MKHVQSQSTRTQRSVTRRARVGDFEGISYAKTERAPGMRSARALTRLFLTNRERLASK